MKPDPYLSASIRTHFGLDKKFEALWSSLKHWDPDLAAHGAQTAHLAIQLARALPVEAPLIRILTWAARLHDIGKLALPRAILDKPGPLDAVERRVIQAHPAYSFGMLQRAEIPAELLQIVLFHHERFDGAGYPVGLKGEDIPITARILAVADVYSALMSRRPYRNRYSSQRALVLMQKSGNAFDPKVLTTLLQIKKGAHAKNTHG